MRYATQHRGAVNLVPLHLIHVSTKPRRFWHGRLVRVLGRYWRRDRNLGRAERGVRAVAGIFLLLYAAFGPDVLEQTMLAIGIYLVASGTFGWCLFHSVLGIKR